MADCQPGINTPCLYQSSVRESHLDNPAEIFAGLFYLREDSDNSLGGNLQIMEIKKFKKSKFFSKKSQVKNKSDLNIFKEIRYEKNKVIFFLNTENSIHNVSSRSVNSLPRNLTNIIFETYDENIKTFSYIKQTKFIFKYKKIFKFLKFYCVLYNFSTTSLFIE